MNDDKDTSKILGFRINATVRIASNFFRNHGLKYMDLGLGIVQGKTLPDEHTLPKIICRFKGKENFLKHPVLKELLFINSGGDSVLIGIHPVYLEKAKK